LVLALDSPFFMPVNTDHYNRIIIGLGLISMTLHTPPLLQDK